MKNFNLLLQNLKSPKNYGTENKGFSLPPWFVTGLVDGEGSWSIAITKDTKRTIGHVVSFSFVIALHSKDLNLLKAISDYFKEISIAFAQKTSGSCQTSIGAIYKHSENMSRYKVSSIKELQVIISHFDMFPLQTQKRSDFELFKRAISIASQGPLSLSGLQMIVNLKSSLNKGLSCKLKKSFPNYVSSGESSRPRYVLTSLPPFWVSGFTEAESCFSIRIVDNFRLKTGTEVQLRFSITQHVRDKNLLLALKEFFGCGNYLERKNKSAGDFIIYGNVSINRILIPFFLNYPLYGTKAIDFCIFRKVAELIDQKAHLTAKGIEEIKRLKLVAVNR